MDRKFTAGSLLFEIYHLLLVAVITSAFVCLVIFSRSMQRDVTSAYRQDFVMVLLWLSPILFSLAFRYTTGRIRPGRIFFQMLGMAFLLSAAYPEIVDRLGSRLQGQNPVSYILAWPLVFFGLYLVITQWLNWKKRIEAGRRRAKGRMVRQIEAAGTVQRNRDSLTEGLRAKRYLEGGFMIEAPDRSRADRWLTDLILLLLIGGFSYALVLLTEAWAQPYRISQYAIYLVALIYPAALYGAVSFVTGRARPGLLFLGSLYSLILFWILMPGAQGVAMLTFPTACFGVGYLLSKVKNKPRQKRSVTVSADPRSLDEEIEKELQMKRQVERKYRSKRQNVRWYGNLLFTRRR
jgi:hypothetical protein